MHLVDIYRTFHPKTKEYMIFSNAHATFSRIDDTLDQLDSVDIFRPFHPKTPEYTFFSNAHGTFSRIDHVLGHKTSLHKFKKIEIIPSIFSDHNGMKLDINYRKKIRKATNTWRLNKMLLNNDWVNEEIK